MGIPLRSGRLFEDADREKRVAVISALAAAQLWPGQNPLNKRFKVGDPDGPFIEVTGVVGDVRSVGLDKPPSTTVYLPYWQRRVWGGPAIAIRTVGALSISSPVRDAIHRIDPELPIGQFQTMEQLVDDSVAQRRFQMTLALLLAVAALVLANLGIYGVVSYAVASRTNEIGLRMALGARGADIVTMILGQAMVPVALGLLGGLIASLVAGRLLAGLLYGVTPTDAATFASVMSTLASVAALASLIPARRAIRIDPATALRDE
jgi:putative ABC transport system permease protein